MLQFIRSNSFICLKVIQRPKFSMWLWRKNALIQFSYVQLRDEDLNNSYIDPFSTKFFFEISEVSAPF